MYRLILSPYKTADSMQTENGCIAVFLPYFICWNDTRRRKMALKAKEIVEYFENPNGPTIGTTNHRVIEKDGLYFKDLDGSGEWKSYDDWRLPAAERAKEYVKVLTTEEKIAQLFISDWRMGKYLPAGVTDQETPVLDESGVLDEGEFRGKTIFGEQRLPGTSTLLKEWFSRHLILRANATAEDMTDWLNQLQAVAEECTHWIPVSVASNSRNENGEVVFGMNDAAGVFATWPGTLGIAAAAKGAGLDLIDEFADCVRREWNACGLRKGYMYMADVMTDPRWQRSYGTFGEDPDFVCEVMDRLIPGIQGGKSGVTADGVAVTTKHFPGGGARENGFDPHYAAGQWNVYATEGSLQKYHIPAFKIAVANHTSSIMPYYSKPAAAKSAVQTDCEGNPCEMEPYGFAYNHTFIQKMLRDQIGFKGYINSDTGIVHNMCWGVEMLDTAERIGFAVNHAGVDLISGLFDNEAGMEAYRRGKNDYYENHPIPEGFTKEQLVLTDEALDRAVTRTLQEMFELGMFENPYRSAKEAVEVVGNQKDWDAAAKVHRQSVVLLKNDGTLPLLDEKTVQKKFYVEAFKKDAEQAKEATKALKEMFTDRILTDDPKEADYAILMVTPSSGEYFNATPGYLELDICEEKIVCDVDQDGKPEEKTHEETTLSGVKRIAEIAEAVHANGGKVIANINFTLAWEVGNIERCADALLAGFDTYPNATLDVIFGRFDPVGKLPITLPKGDEVLAVNEDGICISPNDVPGYDKDQYMPDAMKDENGKAYAYRDAAGNYYELNFGLHY